MIAVLDIDINSMHLQDALEHTKNNNYFKFCPSICVLVKESSTGSDYTLVDL